MIIGRDTYLGTPEQVVLWMSKAQGAPDGGVEAYMRGIATRVAKAAKKKVSVDVSEPFAFLESLENAGFLSVTDGDQSALDTFPARAGNVLVITGDDSHFLGSDMTASFARALVSAKMPTVVGALYDAGGQPAEAPERGAALAPILDDHVLQRAVSTVDDLELTEGRIATVLALETIGPPGNNVGHYGYGTGASSPLPQHSS